MEELAKCILRTHNKMADTWGHRGVDGRTESLGTKRKLGREDHKKRGGTGMGGPETGSGCGVVVKAMDKGVWFKICKIAISVEQHALRGGPRSKVVNCRFRRRVNF